MNITSLITFGIFWYLVGTCSPNIGVIRKKLKKGKISGKGQVRFLNTDYNYKVFYFFSINNEFLIMSVEIGNEKMSLRYYVIQFFWAILYKCLRLKDFTCPKQGKEEKALSITRTNSQKTIARNRKPLFQAFIQGFLGRYALMPSPVGERYSFLCFLANSVHKEALVFQCSWETWIWPDIKKKDRAI